MNTTPDQPEGEDVEAHRIKFKMDSEAATEDDTEGHRSYNSDTTIKGDQTQVDFDEDDDVEGHRVYSSSDTTIKSDQTQVDFDEDDDAEGHQIRPGR
jgi:hypothetical protein